mmetsp:Transcript_27839/g.66292  ORF Transcript_27839/g.66292 Transcript_27839/m.66292 type:complete len:292 (-) Transcript_27839:230-1105(-)
MRRMRGARPAVARPARVLLAECGLRVACGADLGGCGKEGVRGEVLGCARGVPSGHPDTGVAGWPLPSRPSLLFGVELRRSCDAQCHFHRGPATLYAGWDAQLHLSSVDCLPPLSLITLSRTVSSGSQFSNSSRLSTAESRTESQCRRAVPRGVGGSRGDACRLSSTKKRRLKSFSNVSLGGFSELGRKPSSPFRKHARSTFPSCALPSTLPEEESNAAMLSPVADPPPEWPADWGREEALGGRGIDPALPEMTAVWDGVRSPGGSWEGSVETMYSSSQKAGVSEWYTCGLW